MILYIMFCIDSFYIKDLNDDEKYIVEVHNLDSLDKTLQDECKIMLRVFERVNSVQSNFIYKII